MSQIHSAEEFEALSNRVESLTATVLTLTHTVSRQNDFIEKLLQQLLSQSKHIMTRAEDPWLIAQTPLLASPLPISRRSLNLRRPRCPETLHCPQRSLPLLHLISSLHPLFPPCVPRAHSASRQGDPIRHPATLPAARTS